MKIKKVQNENISLRNVFASLDDREKSELSKELLKLLKEKHTLIEDKSWIDGYNNRINLILYNHGLSSSTGLKDYILVDFIEANNFLLNDRDSFYIFGHSLDNIYLTNGELEIKTREKDLSGDYVMDFLFLHELARLDEKFTNDLLKKYFDGEPGRKFFRLLSFYTAVDCLDLITKYNSIIDQVEKNRLGEKINYLFEIYEDFSEEYPLWYKD